MNWYDRYEEAVEAGEISQPNPCEGCLDYDEENDICVSDGGCGEGGERGL